ncbi:phospholipase A2 [Entamoeba marina]
MEHNLDNSKALGSQKNEMLIDSLQLKLINHENEEVIHSLKETNAKEWLGVSEFFPKFFHCSVAVGALDVVKYLVEMFPARLEVKNVINSTLLYTAIENQQDEISEFLVSCGADLLVINGRGNSLLHLLVRRYGNYYQTLIKVILEKKKDLLDVQNCYGETALHHACLAGNVTSVKYLLDSGANPMIETVLGKLPMHFAMESIHSEEIMNLLIQKESKLTTTTNAPPLKKKKKGKRRSSLLLYLGEREKKETEKNKENNEQIQLPTNSNPPLIFNVDDNSPVDESKAFEDSDEDIEVDSAISLIIEREISSRSISEAEEQLNETPPKQANVVVVSQKRKSINKSFIKEGMAFVGKKAMTQVDKMMNPAQLKSSQMQKQFQQLKELYPSNDILTTTPLSYSPTRKYRILSLDGYSRNSFFQLFLLKRLTKKYPMLIAQCNMITGVGSSAILAAALASETSLDLYELTLPVIHHYTYVSKKGFLPSNTSSFNPIFLKDGLKTIFGDRKVSSLPRAFLTYYYQLPHKLKFISDDDLLCDVLMKTCAFPYYFKPYDHCISGSIVQSNPSAFAITKAMENGVRMEDCVVLSLCNGKMKEVTYEDIKNGGVGEMDEHLIDLFYEGQESFVEEYCKTFLKEKYFHFNTNVDNHFTKFNIDALQSFKKIVDQIDLVVIDEWLKEQWIN